MAAINFNREAKTLEEGIVYNFHGHTFRGDTTETEGTITRNGANVTVTFGSASVDVAIFRDAMTVCDVLAVAFARGAHVESGNAPYKADILRVMASEADGYGSRVYTGRTGYHSHTYESRTDCPYFYGVELETEGRNDRAFEAAKGLESNCWYMETDGSLGPRGIEYISTLLRPQDAINPAFFESLCNTLTGLCKSKTVPATGLHVHVSRSAFGETESEQTETAAKVSDMLDAILPDPVLTAIFGRGVNDWAKRLERSEFANALAVVKNVAGANILRDNGIKSAYVAELTKHNKQGHTNNRYHQLNLTNENTIEFRRGKGQISSVAIATIIQFIDTLIKYCRGTKFERLSVRGYVASIPTSNKYNRLRDMFTNSNE